MPQQLFKALAEEWEGFTEEWWKDNPKQVHPQFYDFMDYLSDKYRE